jgi:hypothetical protein
LNELKKGIHHSKKLQRAWNKHGNESFSFEILEKNVSDKDILRIEENYINKLNSYENGYNSYKHPYTAPKGKINGMFGKEPSNKGIISKKRKQIISYNIETGEVKYYDYSSQPMREEGLHPSYTSTFKKLSTSQGRIWFYAEDFTFKYFKEKYLKVCDKGFSLRGKERSLECRIKISNSKKNKKFSENHIKNLKLSLKDKKGKCILRSDGKIYKSIALAARDLNVDRSDISNFLSKKRKSSVKGFTFELI